MRVVLLPMQMVKVRFLSVRTLHQQAHTAALGASANASAEAALALGASANASHANAVALGANSVTKAAVASNEATVNGVYYSGFAANNAASVVSLGDAGKSVS